ncbi:MAG: sulfotransferase, partial [Proteobacteria bacterium]|nr:sulfotransferase [Pseudomonadota bacterium]
MIATVREKQLFFIAATEKSGTTWLQIMLDAHPEAACRGEGQFATRLAPGIEQAVKNYSAFIGDLNAKTFAETKGFPILTEAQTLDLERTAAYMLLANYGAGPDIKAVGEKTPGNIRELDRLKVLFPEAKFIFMIRDGRDVVVSGYSHISRLYAAEAAAESLENYARRTALAWRDDYLRARAFIDANPAAGVMVRYEALHADPAPHLARIFAFLGINASAAVVRGCI